MAKKLSKQKKPTTVDETGKKQKKKLAFSMRETLLNSTVLSIGLLVFAIFMTLVMAGSPPSIGITSPMDGETLTSNDFYLGLMVDDPDWDIDHCEYSVDGLEQRTVDCSGSTIHVDGDGWHTIDAYVYDSKGSMNKASVSAFIYKENNLQTLNK